MQNKQDETYPQYRLGLQAPRRTGPHQLITPTISPTTHYDPSKTRKRRLQLPPLGRPCPCPAPPGNIRMLARAHHLLSAPGPSLQSQAPAPSYLQGAKFQTKTTTRCNITITTKLEIPKMPPPTSPHKLNPVALMEPPSERGTPPTACGRRHARSQREAETAAIRAWWLERQNGVVRENANGNAVTATACDATKEPKG